MNPVIYNLLTLKQIKESEAYKNIPPFYNKSKLNKKDLTALIDRLSKEKKHAQEQQTKHIFDLHTKDTRLVDKSQVQISKERRELVFKNLSYSLNASSFYELNDIL